MCKDLLKLRTHKVCERCVKVTARSARHKGGVKVQAWLHTNGKTNCQSLSAKSATKHTKVKPMC